MKVFTGQRRPSSKHLTDEETFAASTKSLRSMYFAARSRNRNHSSAETSRSDTVTSESQISKCQSEPKLRDQTSKTNNRIDVVVVETSKLPSKNGSVFEMALQHMDGARTHVNANRFKMRGRKKPPTLVEVPRVVPDENKVSPLPIGTSKKKEKSKNQRISSVPTYVNGTSCGPLAQKKKPVLIVDGTPDDEDEDSLLLSLRNSHSSSPSVFDRIKRKYEGKTYMHRISIQRQERPTPSALRKHYENVKVIIDTSFLRKRYLNKKGSCGGDRGIMKEFSEVAADIRMLKTDFRVATTQMFSCGRESQYDPLSPLSYHSSFSDMSDDSEF